jgi:hypothetical protein
MLEEALDHRSVGQWPVASVVVPVWEYPTDRPALLAHFDAADGSQDLLDSTMNHTFSLQEPFPGANHSYISTSHSVFGGSSLRVITVGGQPGYGTVSAGVSPYFNLGNNVDFTVDLWVRPDSSFGAYPRVVMTIGYEGPPPGDPEGEAIRVSHLTIRLNAPSSATGRSIEVSWGDSPPGSGAVDSTGGQRIIGGSHPDAAWTHIAVTREAGTMRLFQGGSLIGALEATPTQSINDSSLLIGGYLFSGTPSYFLKGYIDELRIIKGRADFTSTFTTSEVAYIA